MHIVRHCLNLLAHFHKVYPWTLKNSTSEDQTKKSIKKSSLRGAKKNTRKRDFDTLKKRSWDFEIGPKFSETHIFRGTIRHPPLRLTMNNRRLWNSHQKSEATSFLGPRHLGTFWNAESRKSPFQGFSRGIFHHRHHVVLSEYTQDWEQYHRNVPLHDIAQFECFTDLNLFKYAFNVIQNWETDALQFYSMVLFC